jgi:hypothetical protein
LFGGRGGNALETSRLFNVPEGRECLSYCQLEVLNQSISKDIFLQIDRNFLYNGKEVKSGKIYVYDDIEGRLSSFSQRVRKKIPELLEYAVKVACLPSAKAERIKTTTISLGYGKTFVKFKNGTKKVTFGRYSVNNDLLLDKWEQDRERALSSVY